MPRERNSIKVDLALTNNDDVKDFIIRIINKKITDMQFEREYYESELSIANDQKKVNLSNGRKYSDLYNEKIQRIDNEMDNFRKAINIISGIDFSIDKLVSLHDGKVGIGDIIN